MPAWIAPGRSVEMARVRLFCLPYAGGGSSIFHQWTGALDPAIDVRAVRLPGRENRMQEPAFTAMEPLVTALAEAIGPWLDLPYALFGTSMGSLIAFELARVLAASPAGPPVRLLVAAHRAPHLPDRGPELHRLPDAAFFDELRRLHGMPDEVLAHPELRALLLPLLRADFTVCETYRYHSAPPLDCPIVAFGGSADGDVTREDLEAWRELTRSTFTLRMLPGGHFIVHSTRDALLSAVAEELSPLVASGQRLSPW
jgi:medium-chain acyl-[acyl-carrier-protein] hydrolase